MGPPPTIFLLKQYTNKDYRASRKRLKLKYKRTMTLPKQKWWNWWEINVKRQQMSKYCNSSTNVKILWFIDKCQNSMARQQMSKCCGSDIVALITQNEIFILLKFILISYSFLIALNILLCNIQSNHLNFPF